MFFRDRNTKLKEVYGQGRVPDALTRSSGSPPLNASWAHTGRKLGIFLDFITLDHGARGAYESPQQQVHRLVDMVILHLLDSAGGLAALAARMQKSDSGKSFSLFADSIVRELVRSRLGTVPLQQILAAIGEKELPAAVEEAVRARLIALGMLDESRIRTTPLVKQVRCDVLACPRAVQGLLLCPQRCVMCMTKGTAEAA